MSAPAAPAGPPVTTLRRRRWRRALIVALAVAAAVVIAVLLAPRAMQAAPVAALPVHGAGSPAAVAPARVRVVTWNLAHGRGLAANQLLVGRATLQANLDAIAAVLAAQRADLIALQEVDAPSWWSGGFSHVHHLADRLPGLAWAHGRSVDGLGLRYGTAVFARQPPLSAASVVLPADRDPAKGATIATLAWPDGRRAAFVSVHLHYRHGGRLDAEVDRLIAALAPLPRPLIVAGDFNGGWHDDGRIAARVAEGLGLRAPAPEAMPPTFPASGRRIDWVLCSPPLRPVALRVLPVDHSDHRPVVVDLAWDEAATTAP